MALQATSIERCNDGYWTHPELPDMGENVSKAKLAEFESEQGFSIHFVTMEGDAPEEVSEAYFDKGAPGCLGCGNLLNQTLKHSYSQSMIQKMGLLHGGLFLHKCLYSMRSTGRIR
ncbi:hypothetical protein CAG54_10960 [Vibrio sp. V27_P1S3P104]|uniref:hypothetical protein n=1 Tax=unclassified Vibrio TaxID=2614977 RepID=UPI001372BE5F|nr:MULTISPECIES: hypothetical protein [unclassified Vibrio]NAX35505.1 hypothetical protein [Vibrio sp. V29_P1S30P107]NAX38017.1 hypothetical protein [Vibrio sp. V27_P1S3P104]